MIGAAGHGRYQERGLQGLAEKGESGPDLREVNFGERLMDKAVLFQPSADVKKLDVFLEVDAKMFYFTVADDG